MQGLASWACAMHVVLCSSHRLQPELGIPKTPTPVFGNVRSERKGETWGLSISPQFRAAWKSKEANEDPSNQSLLAASSASAGGTATKSRDKDYKENLPSTTKHCLCITINKYHRTCNTTGVISAILDVQRIHCILG